MGSKKTLSEIQAKKQLCAEMGIGVEDLEQLELDIGEEEEEKFHVDNILDEILDKGLGRSKNKMKKGKDKDQDQVNKVLKHVPISFTSNGRLSVLKQDIETVRNTKDSIDALIQVLEKTIDRLVNEGPVKFSQPPSKPKKHIEHNS